MILLTAPYRLRGIWEHTRTKSLYAVEWDIDRQEVMKSRFIQNDQAARRAMVFGFDNNPEETRRLNGKDKNVFIDVTVRYWRS